MSNEDDIKPMISLRELNQKANIDILIDGLKVKSTCFSCSPINLKVLKKNFNEQSIDFLVELNIKKETKRYRYIVHRLPSEIDPTKVKISFKNDLITIVLEKKENEPWMQYLRSDLETKDN